MPTCVECGQGLGSVRLGLGSIKTGLELKCVFVPTQPFTHPTLLFLFGPLDNQHGLTQAHNQYGQTRPNMIDSAQLGPLHNQHGTTQANNQHGQTWPNIIDPTHDFYIILSSKSISTMRPTRSTVKMSQWDPQE